jgi:hypothetical protein
MNAQLKMLMIAYAITAGAMLLGMWLMRADRRGYLRWPVYSAMAMFLGVWSWNALRRHAMPQEWELTRPALLYYGALGVYALFGLALGLVAGRATRTRNIFGSEIEKGGDAEESRK